MNKFVTNKFALKGDILCNRDAQNFNIQEDGYLICDDGKVAGVYAELPESYSDITVHDRSGKLIVPGLVDLHIHAPQFTYRGTGMDLELLEWLETYAFPEESKFCEIEYAEASYRRFVDDMINGPTTRASIFATLHVPATLMLMDLLEESGLITYVGKVNMDRNSPENLCEENAAGSLSQTREWLSASEKYGRTFPILTPRFIPSCSDELMNGLAELQKADKLPVQSHLSESPHEIKWVSELCPDAESYGNAYLNRGLLGGENCPTIMAHCVYSDEDETKLMKDRGVWIAHCPVSNTCISSGIAPARSFLEQGLNIGLGTDVAGGYSTSMFFTIAETIKVSKLRWRLLDSGLKPLTLEEAFYLATVGGGSFFGNVGTFKTGWAFDALVLDDSSLIPNQGFGIRDRLERTIYLGDKSFVTEKYVAGNKIR